MNFECNEGYPTFEQGEVKLPKIDVVRLTKGLGYGEGGISHDDRKEQVGADILKKVESFIEGPEILVEISKDKSGQPVDDDGCGDGRKWGRIFEGAVERFKSLWRPKVFGGGVTMAASSLIGLGRAAGKSLRQTFSNGISLLNDKEIGYGAHTDSHAHDGNCGCGAIDKAPVIVANVVKYEDKIRNSLSALGVGQDAALDEVFESYRGYAEEIVDQSYAGADVMTEIADNGKIVKELDDEHYEMYVVLNEVEGYTPDQEKIRNISDGKVHIFAVDLWRVKQLAERMYADETDAERQKALLSELVYTLSTAATLTKGDLPVYVVKGVTADQSEPLAA